MASYSPASTRSHTMKLRLARAVKDSTDPSSVLEARRDFAVSRLHDHIQNLLGDCAPLSSEQLAELTAALRSRTEIDSVA